MDKIKSITFDKQAQDNLPEYIKQKMKQDRENSRAIANVKGLGKSSITEHYRGYIIMAQSEQDLKSKQQAIDRGDTIGFYTVQRALEIKST